ncbi:MAG: hypothetical protein IJQ90_00985 [Alphaproteobacteria bacterium]|nr:hypothetical protein [Alphaproteobacteria bacterium]
MKNKKLATGVSGILLALLMLAGCETEQKRNQKITRGFAEWMLNKANTEALAETANDNACDYTDEVWLMKAKQDSAKYRAALERDADIVLTHADKDAQSVWNEIQNTPFAYEYGVGSVINENGEWERQDSVRLGAIKEARIKVNYDEYVRSLKTMKHIRNVRARGK